MGASLVAISPQQNKYSKQIVKKNGLAFPVLSDRENLVASSFGLDFVLSDKIRKIYENFGIDLERFNGDQSWSLPMPGRFVADKNGIIVSADVNPDYTIRPEPDELPDILKSL